MLSCALCLFVGISFEGKRLVRDSQTSVHLAYKLIVLDKLNLTTEKEQIVWMNAHEPQVKKVDSQAAIHSCLEVDHLNSNHTS